MTVNLSFIGGAGWQFFDDNGNVLSGGKLYTYAAGTTTPLTTYTSRDGLTPNANPIILDAAGRTPQQIWSTEGLLYKYVITKSDDVQIRVWDNIGGTVVANDLSADLANTSDNAKGDALVGFRQSNSAGFLTGATARTVNDKLQESVSVKDFGAIGDGLADDTSAIQTAIDAAVASYNENEGTLAVIFPAGTYKLTSEITISRNIRLIGLGWPVLRIAHNGKGITLTGIPSAVLFPRNIPTFEGLAFNTVSGSAPSAIISIGTASGAIPEFINAVTNLRLVNCFFSDITATYIIDNLRGYGLTITGCSFIDSVVTAVIKLRQSLVDNPYWSYATNIISTDFSNIYDGKAIEADAGDLSVYGGVIQGCRNGAVEVGMNAAYISGAQPVNFYGTYFEANQYFHFKSNDSSVNASFNGCRFTSGPFASALVFVSGEMVSFINCSSPNNTPAISGGNIYLRNCNYMQISITGADSIDTDRDVGYTASPELPYTFNGSDGYRPYIFAGSPGVGGGGIIIMCAHSGFPTAGSNVTQVFMLSKRISGAAVDAVSMARHENGDTSTFSFGVDVNGYLTVTASNAGHANYALISQSKYPVTTVG